MSETNVSVIVRSDSEAHVILQVGAGSVYDRIFCAYIWVHQTTCRRSADLNPSLGPCLMSIVGRSAAMCGVLI